MNAWLIFWLVMLAFFIGLGLGAVLMGWLLRHAEGG